MGARPTRLKSWGYQQNCFATLQGGARTAMDSPAPQLHGGKGFPPYLALARDADLLIYDTAIMDDAPDPVDDAGFYTLHTTPTRLGEVAAASGAKRLILSHITPITEGRLEEVKDIVRDQGYRGRIKAARDLMVINVRGRHDRHEDEEEEEQHDDHD